MTEKFSADCEELVENYKQKCVELEAESKLLQQREDELKKTEEELKKTERKIMKERSKLELKKRAVLKICFLFLYVINFYILELPVERTQIIKK